MSDFVTALSDVLSDPLIGALFSVSISLLMFTTVIRCLCSLLGCHPVELFVELGSWLKGKFTSLLCKTEMGFKFAYKIGWARPGIDFMECGQDCDICPRRDDCVHELRKALEVPDAE